MKMKFVNQIIFFSIPIVFDKITSHQNLANLTVNHFNSNQKLDHYNALGCLIVFVEN